MINRGVNIRVKLLRADKTQLWLINELGKRDIHTDKTELSSILSGRRTGKKAETILDESEAILRGQLW